MARTSTLATILSICVFLILLPGVWEGLLAFGWALLTRPRLRDPILIGTVLGVLLDATLFVRIRGLHTFEHELTHAIAALLCFRKVTGFVSTRDQGGVVHHAGGFGGAVCDTFIGLAPYVFPTFTFLSVMARPFVPANWFPWFDAWIGFTFGFHLLSTIRETARNWSSRSFRRADSGEVVQTDIASAGFIFSFVYIPTVTLAIHGLLCAVLVFGFRGFVPWGTVVYEEVRAVGEFLFAVLYQVSMWVVGLMG